MEAEHPKYVVPIDFEEAYGLIKPFTLSEHKRVGLICRALEKKWGVPHPSFPIIGNVEKRFKKTQNDGET